LAGHVGEVKSNPEYIPITPLFPRLYRRLQLNLTLPIDKGLHQVLAADVPAEALGSFGADFVLVDD
jgi:hypothetical protein